MKPYLIDLETSSKQVENHLHSETDDKREHNVVSVNNKYHDTSVQQQN